jgi:hypothetical protein
MPPAHPRTQIHESGGPSPDFRRLNVSCFLPLSGCYHTLHPSASEAKQLSGRSPDPVDSAFQNSLHLSAALAGMVILIVLDYSVHAVGYLLSRSWWRATDSILWILIGLISAI